MAHALTTGNSVNDASQFTTAEIQPTASALVLVFVANVKRIVTLGTIATPTISGSGLSWERVTTVTTPDEDRRLTCFRAMGTAPARSAIVIDFADQIQDICAWSIVEYTDVDTTGVDGAGAIGQSFVATGTGTSLIATLTPADPQHGRTIGAIMLEPTDGQAHPVSSGSGFSEIHQQTATQAAFAKALTMQTQDSTSSASTISWTWAGSQDAAAVVIEVKGATEPSGGGTTPGDPTEAVIRRFEPVLHLHPDESFVPVNAKRYVESAALWAATAPFDDKNSWGTTPLVKASQLSTDPGSATYLGKPNNLVADAANERFLELGGWKDQDQNHEPDVTGGTTNVYADRKAIFDLYNGDLADHKFWYHAELFDETRLANLAGTVSAPALTNTLANFKHPALLCYYLFYPAHEQSVGKDACPNVEAKEVACHAGDWHCFALLLEGDGTTSPDKYTPKFFGISGIRPAPVTGGTTFRPYAFDAEGRITLKVEAWRSGSPTAPVQPDVVGDNPRFYIARGSHSMYTTAGEHEVAPFDDANSPTGCGKFDTPSAVPPPPPSDSIDPELQFALIFLVKTILGGILGAFFPGFVAGIIEAIAATPGFGSDPTPIIDPPNADAAPPAAAGSITVRPRNLTIPDLTGTEHFWPGDQDAQALIVDRNNQVWWPSDDGTKGFRGRWGQRVAPDPLPHRAGVKFPEFWKMFLLALEQGFGDGSLTRPTP